MLKTAGYDRFPDRHHGDSTALTELGKMYAATPVSTWQDWMKFNFVAAAPSVLPKTFDDATFDFYGKTLSGQQAQRARWKRGVGAGQRRAGRSRSARSTSQRHYPAESKAQDGRADRQPARRLSASASPRPSWMDEPTRDQGAGQARRVRSAHRPSGQVDRLFVAQGRARRSGRQCDARGRVRASARSCRGSASRSIATCGA